MAMLMLLMLHALILICHRFKWLLFNFSMVLGVEEERQNQKQTLVIQRDQYLQKRAKLQKDLTQLKSQRTDLLHDNLPETDRLLKENSKLQVRFFYRESGKFSPAGKLFYQI